MIRQKSLSEATVWTAVDTDPEKPVAIVRVTNLRLTFESEELINKQA
jgi:hypothetical protein